MTTLRENVLTGLLVAFLIGPAPSTNASAAMTVRLSSATLLAVRAGLKFHSDQAAHGGSNTMSKGALP